MFRLFCRSLHTTAARRLAAAPSEQKSALATLRKKTGYTFANCKKALELHNNDLAAAEQWLRQQAQSLGWSKATKLEGRTTKQGLVGVLVRRNIGAMVEVNCETDFVARNQHFQTFVQQVTRACAAHAAELPENNGNGALSTVAFDAEYLKRLVPSDGDGSTLSDQLALIIGKVGENASLRRATCFKATDATVHLAGFAHPAAPAAGQADEDAVLVGKFGALVALNETRAPDADVADADVRKNLCQHIVGMNPTKVGNAETDKPAEQKDDETCLIHQEYLLEPSMTVQELLAENGLAVVEFKRFECGEALASEQSSSAATPEVQQAAAA